MLGQLKKIGLPQLPADQAYFLVETAQTLGNRGYFKQQHWAYEKAIDLFGLAGMRYEMYATSVNAALSLDHLSLYKFAVQLLRKAVRNLEKDWNASWPASKSKLKSTALHNMATSLLNSGAAQRAITYNKRALALLQADDDSRMIILVGLANAHRDQGTYRQAEHFYRQAQTMASQRKKSTILGKCALGIGNLYMTISDYDAAICSYEDALKINNKRKKGEDLPTICVALGNAYHERFRKQYAEIGDVSAKDRKILGTAMQLYKYALASTPVDDPISVADILLKCAHLALDLGQSALAKTSYELAFKMVEESGDYHICFEAMIGLGDVALKNKETHQTRDWYEQALILARQHHHFGDTSLALAHIGYFYMENKQPEKAITFLQDSLQISEQLGKDLVAEPKKLGYYSAIHTDYESLIQAHLSINSFAEAFLYLEKSKSKILLEILVTGRISLQKGLIANPLLVKEKQYLVQLRKILQDNQANLSSKPLLDKLSQLYEQFPPTAKEYVSVRKGESLSFSQTKEILSF